MRLGKSTAGFGTIDPVRNGAAEWDRNCDRHRVGDDVRGRAEFWLEPGQVYVINNRWILHNCTAYENHPEPDRRRHLVRLWLERGSAHRGAR